MPQEVVDTLARAANCLFEFALLHLAAFEERADPAPDLITIEIKILESLIVTVDFRKIMGLIVGLPFG